MVAGSLSQNQPGIKALEGIPTRSGNPLKQTGLAEIRRKLLALLVLLLFAEGVGMAALLLLLLLVSVDRLNCLSRFFVLAALLRAFREGRGAERHCHCHCHDCHQHVFHSVIPLSLEMIEICAAHSTLMQ